VIGRAVLQAAVVAGLVTLAAGAVLADDSPLRSPSEPTQATEKVVLVRRAVIGTSQRVKELAISHGEGRHYQKSLSDLLVEERPAPESCGVRVARLFRVEIYSKFHVAASDTCFISNDKVNCSTRPLPGYSTLYLSLNYERRPTELDLTLTAQQFGMWGLVKNAQLAPDHVEWFENLFDCLVFLAECDREPPICARRALSGE
jgi:hypothetical protein